MLTSRDEPLSPTIHSLRTVSCLLKMLNERKKLAVQKDKAEYIGHFYLKYPSLETEDPRNKFKWMQLVMSNIQVNPNTESNSHFDCLRLCKLPKAGSSFVSSRMLLFLFPNSQLPCPRPLPSPEMWTILTGAPPPYFHISFTLLIPQSLQKEMLQDKLNWESQSE